MLLATSATFANNDIDAQLNSLTNEEIEAVLEKAALEDVALEEANLEKDTEATLPTEDDINPDDIDIEALLKQLENDPELAKQLAAIDPATLDAMSDTEPTALLDENMDDSLEEDDLIDTAELGNDIDEEDDVEEDDSDEDDDSDEE